MDPFPWPSSHPGKVDNSKFFPLGVFTSYCPSKLPLNESIEFQKIESHLEATLDRLSFQSIASGIPYEVVGVGWRRGVSLTREDTSCSHNSSVASELLISTSYVLFPLPLCLLLQLGISDNIRLFTGSSDLMVLSVLRSCIQSLLKLRSKAGIVSQKASGYL